MTEKEQEIIQYIEMSLVAEMNIFYNIESNINFSEDNHKSKLKEISSYGDNKINDIMDFVRENINDPIDDILKGVLDIMRGEVKIDYTYLTEPLVTPAKTETVVDSVDLTKFASLPPQPYPSWIISDDLTTWEPPVKYPDPLGIGEGFNVIYTWNEETKQFENILPETPQPFPSWSAGYIAEQLSIGWIPPKPYPDGTGEGYNKSYRWNEETLTWQDILI